MVEFNPDLAGAERRMKEQLQSEAELICVRQALAANIGTSPLAIHIEYDDKTREPGFRTLVTLIRDELRRTNPELRLYVELKDRLGSDQYGESHSYSTIIQVATAELSRAGTKVSLLSGTDINLVRTTERVRQYSQVSLVLILPPELDANFVLLRHPQIAPPRSTMARVFKLPGTNNYVRFDELKVDKIAALVCSHPVEPHTSDAALIEWLKKNATVGASIIVAGGDEPQTGVDQFVSQLTGQSVNPTLQPTTTDATSPLAETSFQPNLEQAKQRLIVKMRPVAEQGLKALSLEIEGDPLANDWNVVVDVPAEYPWSTSGLTGRLQVVEDIMRKAIEDNLHLKREGFAFSFKSKEIEQGQDNGDPTRPGPPPARGVLTVTANRTP